MVATCDGFDAGATAANLSYSVDDRVLAGSPWLPLTGTSPVLFPGRHVTKGGNLSGGGCWAPGQGQLEVAVTQSWRGALMQREPSRTNRRSVESIEPDLEAIPLRKQKRPWLPAPAGCRVPVQEPKRENWT